MDNNLPIPLAPEAVAVMGNLESRLYSVTQVSRILGLPTTWIYERTRRDAIPYHRLGKYIRFTVSDLAAILAKCSRGPKSDAAITQ